MRLKRFVIVVVSFFVGLMVLLGVAIAIVFVIDPGGLRTGKLTMSGFGGSRSSWAFEGRA